MNHFYFLPLVALLYVIVKEDLNHYSVSDFWIIMIGIILMLKDGFHLTEIIENVKMIVFTLGVSVVLKIVIENFLFYISKGNKNFTISEADVLLVGVLGMYFNASGFLLFLYTTFLFWFGVLILKIYYPVVVGVTRAEQKGHLKFAFTPYIVSGFFVTIFIGA